MENYPTVLFALGVFATFPSASEAFSQGSFDGLDYVNFIVDKFSFLNITSIGRNLIEDQNECGFACIEIPACFSYNVAASPDINEQLLCELLPSDKYNNSEKFLPSQFFHHFSIPSPCSSSPCKNNGKCISLYQEKSYRCVCKEEFRGQNCKTNINECDSSPCLNNGTCADKVNGFNCTYPLGFDGDRCETELKSCSQLRQDGINSSGVYTIKPDGGKPMQVLCDMTTDGGGWTVFQRRLDGSVDFYLDWASYKNGFGDLNGEFWLGNDNLHRLTAADDVKLRVDLEDFDGNITYAEYTTFKVADEGDKYRLVIGGYNGTAGDSMAGSFNHSGMKFTTKDQDNDVYYINCAVKFKGAWWYKGCHKANLNGMYLRGLHASFADGINWYTFRDFNYSLKRSEMKIRPKM